MSPLEAGRGRLAPAVAVAAAILASAIGGTPAAAATAAAANDDGRLQQGPVKTEVPYPDDASVARSDVAIATRTFKFWSLLEYEYVPDGKSVAMLASLQPLSNGGAISVQISPRAEEDHALVAILGVSKEVDPERGLRIAVGDAEVLLSKPKCDVMCSFVMPGKTLLSMLPVSPSRDRMTLSWSEHGREIRVPLVLEGLTEALAARSNYRTPFSTPR